MCFSGRSGGKQKCNICILLCLSFTSWVTECWADMLRSRESAVQEGQMLCRQGKLRHGKGGDCLRLEEKMGWVPALRQVPEMLRGRQEAAAGCRAG